MNKGFTLIEILAVLIILGILFGISVVLIFPIINSSRETTHNAQINTILEAAYDYSLMHTEILPEDNSTYILPLALLKEENLIDTNLIDPNTGMAFSDDLIINISKNAPSTNSEYKKEGIYYYVINYNEGTNKPTITLNGFSGTSDTVNIDVNGGIYAIPEIQNASSYDATYVNIVKGNNIVPYVDLSSYGIYKITYTVKTSSGVGSKTISIVVDDKQKPSLATTSEFENPKTISVNDSIDLLKGISCTDNSGKCKIRIDGTVNAKKVGTYNIKYIALDDAGNKSEPVYRVVKVN